MELSTEIPCVAMPPQKLDQVHPLESYFPVSLESIPSSYDNPLEFQVCSLETSASQKKPNTNIPGLSLQIDILPRVTGRLTELYDLDIQPRAQKPTSARVCCCFNPYVSEEETVYFPGFDYVDPTDIYLHKVTLKIERIFCNLIYVYQRKETVVIQRAKNGVILPSNFDLSAYELVKAEPCHHRHHDLRRYSPCGRLCVHICTMKGLLSTLSKCSGCAPSVNETAVQTLSCERQLYRRNDVKST